MEVAKDKRYIRSGRKFWSHANYNSENNAESKVGMKEWKERYFLSYRLVKMEMTIFWLWERGNNGKWGDENKVDVLSSGKSKEE